MAYMAKTGGTSVSPKQVSYEDVVMGKQLEPGQKRQAQMLVKKFRDVFMMSPDDILPALQIEPVKWQLKDRYRAGKMQTAQLGSGTKDVLEALDGKTLDQGLIVPADKSQWASRPVLVPKYRATRRKVRHRTTSVYVSITSR